MLSDVKGVEEVQGVEGPYGFSEHLFQRLWYRRELDLRDAQTLDGRGLRILDPGRWNRLGGPDFLDARIELAGELLRGDIELHLRAPDWDAHGHARDPAYDRVCLHVVLFPPTGTLTLTRGAGDRLIPILVALPRLRQDLESYAAAAAVELLANRPTGRMIEELGRLPTEARRAVIAAHAERRWQGKVRQAGLRLAKLGWREACHQTALEILGYRFNRAPMLRIATRWPFAAWSQPDVPALAASAEREGWSLQGVRPANRPERRLRQYAEWVAAVPDWPERWRDEVGLEAAGSWSEAEADRTDWLSALAGDRRGRSLARVRTLWVERLTGGAVGGTRFDTLMGDGLLPLLAAVAPAQGAAARAWWRIGRTGDLPPALALAWRELADGTVPRLPLAQGPLQGLLGWLIERETAKGLRPLPRGHGA